MPPTTTSTSSSPFSRSSSMTRGQMCMCAPDRIDRPMTSASSCSAARDDLLRRLAQARVDHLHAGVAQRPGDDLGAAVVAVEARLGDDDADFLIHGCSRSSAVQDPQLRRDCRLPSLRLSALPRIRPTPRAGRRTSRRPWHRRGPRRAAAASCSPCRARACLQRVERARRRARLSRARLQRPRASPAAARRRTRRCRACRSAPRRVATKSLTPTMICLARSTACWNR